MKTYSYRQIIHLALPILVGTIMEQLIGLTDTIFLGRVGEVEQGAAAPAGVLYITIFMVGLGFSVGGQIVMSRRNGEGRYAEVGKVFYHCLAFLLLAASALFALSRWLIPDLLSWVMSDPMVEAAAEKYLYWRVWGFFFAFAGLLFRAFYVSILNTKTLTMNSLVMVVSNIFFNYILIFGYGAIPPLGIVGAALGSVLAEALSVLFYVLYTRRKVNLEKYGLNCLPRTDFPLLKRVLRLSSWTMLQDVVSHGAWFIFFLSVEHLGKSELAASNIMRNISAVAFMSIVAIGITASTLVGNLMGEGEIAAVRPLLRKAMRLAYMVFIPLALFVVVFPDLVLSIFTADAALKEMAHLPLLFMLGSNLVCVPAYIYMRGVSASGNTKTAFVAEMIALAIYMVYIVVAIFHYRVPLWACTLCEYVYYAIIALICGSYLRWGKWYEKQV